jgi:hypothetical protein
MSCRGFLDPKALLTWLVIIILPASAQQKAPATKPRGLLL